MSSRLSFTLCKGKHFRSNLTNTSAAYQPAGTCNAEKSSEDDSPGALVKLCLETVRPIERRAFLPARFIAIFGLVTASGCLLHSWRYIVQTFASSAQNLFVIQNARKQYLSKINDAQIPVMIVQGDKDTAVPVENTRKWVDTMKELGMKYEHTEIPNGDHGTVFRDGMPDIFKFFAEHPKAGIQ